MAKKLTICVDFDGVIADYSKGFQGPDVFGEPLPHAGENMSALKQAGWKIIIHTTRPDTPALRKYLKDHAIPYDEINKNSDQPEGANPGKPIANLYLDDRAMRFHGWDDALYAIDAMLKKKEIITESALQSDWQELKALFEDQESITVILEAAGTPLTDALHSAKSFDDIWNVFKKAFRWGVDEDRFKGIKFAAGKLQEALAILHSGNQDPEARYFALNLIGQYGNDDAVKLAGVDKDAINKDFRDEFLNKHVKLFEGYKGQGQQILDTMGVEDSLRTRQTIEIQCNALTAQYQKMYDEAKAPFEEREREASQQYHFPLLQALEDFGNKRASDRAELVLQKPGGYKGSWDLTDEESEARRKWVEQLDAFDEEHRQKYHELYIAQNDAHQKYVQPITDEKWKALEEITKPFNEQLNALRDRQKEIAREVHSKVINHLLGQSPISEAQASSWIQQNALMDKKAIAKARKAGYAPEDVQKDLAEFYRMTGGRLSRLEYTTIRQSRSAAAHWTGALFVGSSFGKKTFFHELAHLLEDDGKIKATAQAFLDKRRESATLYSLASLTGNRNYKSDEVAYKDSFHDPYVGKYYRNSTEVISMGMQMLASPEAMLALQEKDPEHLAFMLGICASKPHLDSDKVKEQQGEIQQKKSTAQKVEEITKDLDKKIAKAGDFWTAEGVTLEPYTKYGKSKPSYYYVYWPHENRPGYSHSQTFKSEKVMKRALYLWIAKGKPNQQDPWGLFNLSYQMQKQGGNLPAELLAEGVPTLNKGQ